jgi:hypothetical protein
MAAARDGKSGGDGDRARLGDGGRARFGARLTPRVGARVGSDSEQHCGSCWAVGGPSRGLAGARGGQ